MSKQVTCNYCQRSVAITEAISYHMMEALDGDTLNLVSSNLRMLDEEGYECHDCLKLDALKYPAIIMHDEEVFRRGYEIGLGEARRGCFIDTLTDQDLVATLKGMFHHYYQESGSEETLRYGIGGLVGLLHGLSTGVEIDAYFDDKPPLRDESLLDRVLGALSREKKVAPSLQKALAPRPACEARKARGGQPEHPVQRR
jgi:hypothetical protein